MKDYETPKVEIIKLSADEKIAANALSGTYEEIDGGEVDLSGIDVNS